MEQKSDGARSHRVEVRYALIDQLRKQHPVAKLCDLLNAAKSGYQRWGAGKIVPPHKLEVITVGMLAKIRRMHIRERLSVRERVRRTGLSGNTIRNRLRQADVVEPKHPKRETISVVDIVETGNES